jgi:hypothetical protein
MGVASLRGALAGAAIALWIGAAACGGGGGPLATMSSGGREDPGATRDTPPTTRDPQGGNCIQCDVLYECSPSQSNTSIILDSSQGLCTQTLIDLVCSGTLFGTTSCSGGGGGSFTCGSVTCTPSQQGLPPAAGGGTPGSSTGGGVSGSSGGTGGSSASSGGSSASSSGSSSGGIFDAGTSG